MGRKKNYVREEVLEAARDLFWVKGYEGTHLQELVEATGTNRFSLYSEFHGKGGLFTAALELYLSDARLVYESHLTKEPLGIPNIRHYFDSLSFESESAGCFFVNTITEKHVVPAEAFEAAAKLANYVEKLFLLNLKAAEKSGQLNSSDRDLLGLARLLCALDQGLAVYGVLSPTNRGKAAMIQQLDYLLR